MLRVHALPEGASGRAELRRGRGHGVAPRIGSRPVWKSRLTSFIDMSSWAGPIPIPTRCAARTPAGWLRPSSHCMRRCAAAPRFARSPLPPMLRAAGCGRPRAASPSLAGSPQRWQTLSSRSTRRAMRWCFRAVSLLARGAGIPLPGEGRGMLGASPRSRRPLPAAGS